MTPDLYAALASLAFTAAIVACLVGLYGLLCRGWWQ